MATKNPTNAAAGATGEETKAGAAASAPAVDGPPKGWTEVASDRLVYKPEQCQSKPVVGLLLGRLELPEGPNGTPWYAFVIRCTQPTLGVDRDDNVQEVAIGQEILMPETHRLMDLKRAAENSEHAFEVWVKPKKQVDLGGGKKMWTYTVAVNPKITKRTADQQFFVGGQAQAAPQLGAGTNGALGANAPDTPF